MNIPPLVYQGLIFLLGALAAAAISHFLGKDREKQIHKIVSFNAAAETFRHSFDDALLNIEQGEHPVLELLRNFHLPHKVAMWHFKYYFTGKARQRFEKTWKDYEDYYNANYEKGSVLASVMASNTPVEEKLRNEYRKHIEDLIKYTT
jgi:hypothetical protein